MILWFQNSAQILNLCATSTWRVSRDYSNHSQYSCSQCTDSAILYVCYNAYNHCNKWFCNENCTIKVYFSTFINFIHTVIAFKTLTHEISPKIILSSFGVSLAHCAPTVTVKHTLLAHTYFLLPLMVNTFGTGYRNGEAWEISLVF